MTTRTTVYFEPQIHKALKMQSIESGNSLSSIINRIAERSLAEDQDDLQSFRKRKKEKTISYENFLDQLKKDGKL